MGRRLAAAIAGLALSASALPVGAVPAAAALQGGVAFTGAALPTWQTDGIVWATASAGGLVFVGGDFAAIRPPGTAAGDPSSLVRTNLAVLDGATGNPVECAPAVTGSTNASVRALEVSPDGTTLYIGGSFTSVGGVTGRKHIAAVDISSCRTVTSFAPQPTAPVRAVEAVGSTVYFGGGMSFVGSVPRGRAAAVTAVGTTAPGSLLEWDPQFDKEVRAIAVRPGGSEVVVGGDFDLTNGSASHALAVVHPVTGDTLFAYPTLIPAKSVVKDLAVDDTGFYTANEGAGFQVFDGRIALDWATHAQRWRDTCLGATQAVVVYAGLLYSGSHVHDCTTMNAFPDGLRYHLLAQSVDNPTLLPWFPQTNDGIGEALGPRDMVVSRGTSDYMWVVGEFTTVNGVKQQGLTRFGQGPAQAGPTTAIPSVTSVRAGQARVAWRQSFDADDATLTYRVYRDGSSTPLHTATGTSWFWSRQQMSFLDQGLTPGATHSYKVSVTDGAKTVTSTARSVVVAAEDSAYAARVVGDGATGFWRYDEGSDVFFSDTSPADNNVTLTGGTASYRVTPGALKADPSPAMSVAGTKATLYSEERMAAPGAFTVETWFRTTTTAGGKLIGFGDKQVLPSRNFDRHVYMTDDGRLVFGVDNGSRVTLTTAQAYNDGRWHHVVATQGPAGMAMFMDGVLVGSNSTTTAMQVAGYWRVAGDNISCRVTTCADRVWPNAPTSDFFGGSLDETAVYPTALSAQTVQAHFTLATGKTNRTMVVEAEADTMVKQASPDSAFGSANPLLSDGQDLSTTGSAINSYLRFQVPALAEGEEINTAAVQLRTVPSYGGSSNGPAVWRTENATSVSAANAMTWNSGRPARTGTSPVGNFASLPHDATVSTAVTGVGAGLVSLELAPESNDGTIFDSREDGTAAHRPKLVVNVLTDATTEPAPEPEPTARTVVVEAEADTMVKQASPDSAFGGANPLLSDGQDLSTTGSAIHSYLRFSVPALAEGEQVTAASLRLRTVPTYGGTSNGPAIWRTSDSTSVSAFNAMTWNSGRPARSGTRAIGNFGSVGHDLPVSAAVTGVGAGVVSFELAPESNDGLIFSSRETSTTADRPQLVLTVEKARTVVVEAEADTMVKQASPDSAFGGANPLLSDGQDLSTTGSAIHSYLRFNVPALAAGEQISAASLRLLTVPTYGGTSNGPAIWRTADSTSVTAADAMTWNSGRPARSGTSPVGNYGSVGHDLPVFAAVGGIDSGVVSFELAPESNDGLIFRSREQASSSDRPQLVLTITTS